jgi:hypothetical protein
MKKETYFAKHISGECKLSAVECRLIDIDDRIINFNGSEDLSLLKYERMILAERIIANKYFSN